MIAGQVTTRGKDVTKPADGGLVLLNAALKPVAFDRGAINILLGSQGQDDERSPLNIPIPKEIVDVIKTHNPFDLSSLRLHFLTSTGKYNLRAYRIEPQDGTLNEPLVVLHFERASTAERAVREVGAAYHLTEREQEALVGIISGLSSKQLAAQMKISPNTVKAYVRLIMVKMGVETRAGISAKLLLLHTL